MPNQMIALQARNPQLPDPQQRTARMANMMNMARQTEAAQLQGERIRQEMEYETELQAPRLAEAGAKADTERLKYAMLFYKESANDLINSNTPEQAVSRGERLKAMFPDPALQARIDETITDLVSDPSQFEAKRRQMLRNTLDAEKQLAIEHSDVFDAEGNLILMERSPVGAFPTRVTPGVITDLPSTATQASPPRATPTAGAGTSANMRATRGANTTPQDLMNQGMDPRNIPSGMPTSRPVSFNQSDMGGAGAVQMTPDVMSRIVDSAFQTGVMAQVDFDQLLASQPPQNKQALMNAFQQANITLQADAPSLADSGMGQQQMAANPVQRPQSQFADLRGPAPQSQTAGLRGAPPMEQTLAQYQVGQQIKGRNPNMALTPSPVAPAVLAAQEAAKTTAQEQAKEAAAAAAAPKVEERERNLAFSKERGTADAKFMELAPTAIDASNEGRDILTQMVGDAYIDERGKITVPKDGRRPHSGFEGVVGLGFPGMRFVPGSPEADFDKKFKQVIGKAFLKAFNDLKGGGQITEKEGEKATEAITRLSRFSSEVEFIRAARELENILAKGEQRALDRRARIEGKSAPRVSTSTSKKSKPRELIFNPATGDFE